MQNGDIDVNASGSSAESKSTGNDRAIACADEPEELEDPEES